MSGVLAETKMRTTRRERRWCVRLEWKPADLWVGAFYSTTTGPTGRWAVLDVWVCVVPCLPIHVFVNRPAPCGRRAVTEVEVLCRCVWRGVPCAKMATQEDGLCDWCGVRRPDDMRNNPFAMWSPDGEYLGLGGGATTGYNHQAGWGPIPSDVRPTACWMEASRG